MILPLVWFYFCSGWENMIWIQVFQQYWNHFWEYFKKRYHRQRRIVVEDRRFWRTICSDESTVLSWYVLNSISLKCPMSLKCWECHWNLFWWFFWEHIEHFQVIVVVRAMKFLAVVTPPYIYLGFSTWKTFWEDSMRSCGYCNVIKHNYQEQGSVHFLGNFFETIFPVK